MSIDDPEVHYGDAIYIQSMSFEGERLAKDGEYMTTASIT